MKFLTCLTISIFLFIALLFNHTHATTFDIRNNCPYTVWAAAVPGGGMRLDRGQTWTINAAAGTKGARIWARTDCNFDGAGRRRCQTGDCNGLLNCQADGQLPNTLAEYGLNQFNNFDFFDISLVDGFNVPMELRPTFGGGGCCSIRCTADIKGLCPNPLRAPRGSNNPCTGSAGRGRCQDEAAVGIYHSTIQEDRSMADETANGGDSEGQMVNIIEDESAEKITKQEKQQPVHGNEIVSDRIEKTDSVKESNAEIKTRFGKSGGENGALNGNVGIVEEDGGSTVVHGREKENFISGLKADWPVVVVSLVSAVAVAVAVSGVLCCLHARKKQGVARKKITPGTRKKEKRRIAGAGK